MFLCILDAAARLVIARRHRRPHHRPPLRSLLHQFTRERDLVARHARDSAKASGVGVAAVVAALARIKNAPVAVSVQALSSVDSRFVAAIDESTLSSIESLRRSVSPVAISHLPRLKPPARGTEVPSPSGRSDQEPLVIDPNGLFFSWWTVALVITTLVKTAARLRTLP